MKFAGIFPAVLLTAFLSGCGDETPQTPPEPMSVNDFRHELVGMPLCGKPKTGELAGKVICTVHLADGTAIVAGSGVLARGIWDTDGKRICRRDAVEPLDRRRCVDYERLGNNRYRNSDGVEFCIGPCP
ncbi:MAG TPA: hypothetical protein VGH49_09735 [Xanthobacteraceae bacterium]